MEDQDQLPNFEWSMGVEVKDIMDEERKEVLTISREELLLIDKGQEGE